MKIAGRKHYVPNGIRDDNCRGMQLSGDAAGGRLAAVVAAFSGWLPGDRGKGVLEEGVVDDVMLVIFSFDDPVAGIGFALSGVGEDDGGGEALRGVDEKGPAGAKRVHETLSWRHASAAKDISASHP